MRESCMTGRKPPHIWVVLASGQEGEAKPTFTNKKPIQFDSEAIHSM